jgi:hypothetical protein
MDLNLLVAAVRHMMDRAGSRARKALDGHPESGALTLEWMIIAALIAGMAIAAAALFSTSIGHYTSQLP